MRKVFMETMALRLESGLKRNDLIDILIQVKDSQKNDPDGIGKWTFNPLRLYYDKNLIFPPFSGT